LYSLLFSTGYYMAWFFGLGLLISSPIVAYIAWPAVRTWWNIRPLRVRRLGLAASVSFLAAFSIFAVIYVPVLATGAARGFGEYLVFAPTPIDVVNVGEQNLVWSGLIRWLHLIRDDRLSNGEVAIALTPLMQILVASSAALALFRPGLWPANDTGTISRAFVIAGAITCLLFYLLTVKTHNHSLFHFLYAVVPGAKAIRVGYRGMVVANLFAVTAIGLSFDRVVRIILKETSVTLRTVRLGGVTAVLALAVIEQVNLAQAAYLSRRFERRHLAAVANHSQKCLSFYVASEAGQAPYEVQIDAMMIAQSQHLPTINGYSGLTPPGWDFYNTNDPDYERHVAEWTASRQLTLGVCRLDVGAGTWSIM
jgi:hypothetical protein